MSLNFSYNESDYSNDCDELVKLSSNADVVGDFYGLIFDVDEILTRGSTTVEARSYGVGILGNKSGVPATYGDCAWLRINGSNYDANAATYNMRGINCSISNRSGGVVGELSNIISFSLKSGSTTATARALQIDAQDLAATAKTEFGGLDVAINREGLAATTEYGIQIRTRGTINSEVNAAIRLSKDATDHGFTNLFNIETDAVNVEAATGHTDHDTDDIVIPIVYNGSTFYIVAQDSKG
jgi:hypothetical protein